MKNLLLKVFSLAVVASLTLSACGGGFSQNPLIVDKRYWKGEVYPTSFPASFRGWVPETQGDGWYKINNTGTGDLLEVQVENGVIYWQRTEGVIRKTTSFDAIPITEASVEDMAYAAKIQMELLGLDPGLVRVDPVNRTFTTIDLGPQLNYYLGIYGDQSRVTFATRAAINQELALFDKGVALLDNSFRNTSVNMANGVVSRHDFGFMILDRGAIERGYPIYPKEFDRILGSRNKFRAYLELMYGQDEHMWLNTGALPDEPYDKPGSLVVPTAAKPASPAIWEEIPYPPEVGANFRGSDVFEVRVDSRGRVWGAFAGNPGRDVTWYTVENGQVVFQREFAGYFQITEEIDDYVRKFETGTGSTAWATVDNGKVYMESSDLGVPYDSYIVFGEKPSLQSLQSDALSIELEYMRLYDLGIAFEDASEVGTRQITKESTLVRVVDYEFAVNPRASTMPHLKDRPTYQQWVRTILREDFAILADDFGYMLDDIVPPVVAMQVVPIVPVPAQGTIPVNILDYNGRSQIIWLTEAEYASGILKTPEAVEFLRAKNVAMPPASKWTVPLSFVGRSFIWALDAYGVYYTIDQTFDARGLGKSVQLNGIDMNTDNFSETANKNWTQLANEGHWTMSPLLTWYYESNDDFFNLMQGRIHEKEPCAPIRLDDRVRFGILGDDDVNTPFIACPIEKGFTITNFLDGNTMAVTKNGDSWTVTGSYEMNFVSAIGNPSGNYYISPMRLWNDGVLLNVLPTWQEIP